MHPVISASQGTSVAFLKGLLETRQNFADEKVWWLPSTKYLAPNDYRAGLKSMWHHTEDLFKRF